MKNKLQDLTNHLFAALERIQDEHLDAEGIKREITRATAITGLAREIIATGRLAVDAQRVAHDIGGPAYRAPKLLGLDSDDSR